MDLQKKKSRKLDESQELISLARKRLQQRQSEFEKIASAWAVELQKMAPQQQLFAKRPLTIFCLKAKWALCAGIPCK
jgi:hypothetical protein